MCNKKIFILATVSSVLFHTFSLTAAEKYFAQTGNENIVCSITNVTKTEAEKICNSEIEHWGTQESLPWFSLLPKITLPKNCVALNVVITNNTPQAIYIPGDKYLGITRIGLNEPYNKTPWKQYAISSIPAIFGGLATMVLANHKDNSSAALLKKMVSYSPLFLGIGIFLHEFMLTLNLYQKLQHLTPSCKNATLKINPGETFEDMFLVDENKLSDNFSKEIELVYVTEKLKKWNPDEMTTIPNDGYTYYFEEETLDISNIDKDIVINGLLIFDSPKTKIILGNNKLHVNGDFFLNDGYEISLEKGFFVFNFDPNFWSLAMLKQEILMQTSEGRQNLFPK